MPTSAHCQGSLKTHSSVTVSRRGAPVKTLQVEASMRENITMKKAKNPYRKTGLLRNLGGGTLRESPSLLPSSSKSRPRPQ